MTLLEIIMVVVIIAVGASGLSFSLGALTKTNLKSGATKLGAAARYAYNRAIIQGTTVRIVFDIPGNSFSVEEAHGRVTLSRADDERRFDEDGESTNVVAADPWAAAETRVSEAIKPTLGASPFGPLKSSSGDELTRFKDVGLGRRVQIVKLIVPHHPDPVEEGQAAVHFFPGGMTEHAVIHLSDGSDTVYSVEIHPLTGRARVRDEAYVPEELFGDPDDPEASEVDL
ncbi:MAG: hypothetical protein PVI30_07365 [Myxococcales bacterium]|jgi:Tfp pilus assembly protein FimT